MQRLGDQGILLRRRAGNAVLYRLNREHLAAWAIIALASQKAELIERLRDTLRVARAGPLRRLVRLSGVGPHEARQ